jgi:hypothetical protein
LCNNQLNAASGARTARHLWCSRCDSHSGNSRDTVASHQSAQKKEDVDTRSLPLSIRFLSRFLILVCHLCHQCCELKGSNRHSFLELMCVGMLVRATEFELDAIACRPKGLVQDSALWRIDCDLSDTKDSKDELRGSIQSSGENTRGSNPTLGGFERTRGVKVPPPAPIFSLGRLRLPMIRSAGFRLLNEPSALLQLHRLSSPQVANP